MLEDSLAGFLLNSAWQIPLLALVAWAVCGLLRKGPAAHRHAVWVTALAASVALPLASIRSGSHTQVPTITPVEPAASVRPAVPAAPAEGVQALRKSGWTIPLARRSATLLAAGWLLWILAGLARLVVKLRNTVAIRAAAQSRLQGDCVARAWARCREAFGCRDVELLCSAAIPGPVTMGLRRKVIILPEAMFEETSTDLLETAIGHEMAHIVRRDYAWSLAQELLSVPISFHPVCRLIRRSIENAREMACDELVTEFLLEPGVYARSMVSIAAAAARLPRPGYSLGVFDGDTFEERIKRLLEPRAWNGTKARLLFIGGLSALVLCAVFASSLAVTARAQSPARAEMRLGAAAYNSGNYRAAIEHFGKAVQMEPANLDARLFLANTLMGERLWEPAEQQYRAVLAVDPRQKVAVYGMMTLALQALQPKEAREWAGKLIEADGNDKGAWYSAGMLDWAIVFPEVQRARQAAGAQPQDYWIPDANLRRTVRDQYLSVVEDGMRSLETALRLDPNFDDAMAYMNLLLRLKAGMVDSQSEANALIAAADQWVAKAVATKRQRASAPRQLPLQLDVERPPMPAAPLPPPPPPPPPPSGSQNASAAPPPRPRNQVEQPLPFWHVAGSTDMPAIELFRALRAKGFGAMIFRPDDGQVRVIAGPYVDRQSLDRAKGELEQAGFRPLRVW